MFAAVTTAYSQSPSVSGCPVLPADNVWNTRIDQLPVDSSSATYINSIGASSRLWPNFGTVYGEHLTYVTGTQVKVPVTFTYSTESDAGPYPIPSNVLIESGSDHHAFIIDTAHCVDYELYGLVKQSNGTWHAGSGAIFPLNTDALRPAGWTSADAAGLQVLPGFVRYDEILAGHINHALRFTAPRSRYGSYLWPARHWAASVAGTQYPQFGQRFRLKAGVNISGFSPHMHVVLQALKTYGMILADNGLAWNLDGLQDARFNDAEVNTLKNIIGADFEAVNESSLMASVNTAQIKTTTTIPKSAAAPSGWVNIVSKNSGLCLGVIGGSNVLTLGIGMEQATCVNGTHQEFQFVPVTGGYKILIRSSGQALDVRAYSLLDGAIIQQWLYHGTTNEIWHLVPTSDGYTEIVANSSGKCIDVAGISKLDHALVHQWAWWGGDNQKWSFVPAD
jgi:hypothetical protein